MNNISAAATLPRLCMINSMAGFGRISTFAALPVISTMQVQVCPVPTSILSNHMAFPTFSYQDFTPYMRDYIRAWKELNLSFDGLYCGFLGSVEQMTIVKEFLKDFRPPFFLLDPVMGDHGRAYSTITSDHIAHMKELAAHADILTPNLTEACLLTDTPYQETGWTEQEIAILAEKLASLGPGRLVITGYQKEDCFVNYILDNHRLSSYAVPAAGRSRSGTGDLFASIISASALQHVDFSASVKKASDFIAACIRGAEEMMLPILDGVPYEKYLYLLQDAPT